MTYDGLFDQGVVSGEGTLVLRDKEMVSGEWFTQGSVAYCDTDKGGR